MGDRRCSNEFADLDETLTVGRSRSDRVVSLFGEPGVEVARIVEAVGARFEVGGVAEPTDELEAPWRPAIGRPPGIGERSAEPVDWMSCRHVTSITRMTVAHPIGRRRALRGAACAAVLLAAACGSDQPGGPTAAPTTTITNVSSTVVATDEPIDPSTEMPATHVVAGLGYPRDLLDRGRVNIRIDRPDDVAFVLLDKQLVARHFTPAPPESRRTVIPSNGQVVAVQAPFGDVSDCEDSSLVDGELVVSYLIGDDPAVRHGSIEIDDATTLDQIRLQICTQRRVVEYNDFELDLGEVDGETMSARLVVRRREGDDRLAFDSIKGTVLFGAAADVPAGSPERVLDIGDTETAIGITFAVNRCDPHAVGETTRKYGLDVFVAVGDMPAQRVSVPIDTIIPQLDEMLERCKQRTGQ